MPVKRMYQATDEYLEKLKPKIRREFNHLSLLPFDELTVARTKEETTQTYRRLLDFNQKYYKRIAELVREYALSLVPEKERKKSPGKFDSEAFIFSVLAAYNAVTGYLYKREAERKRLRLVEEMLTAREYLDRDRFDKSIHTAANLWYTQSMQYSIEVEDEVALDAWKDVGITRVMWVTQRDGKVCKPCRELDQKIFKIREVPPKQHYNCRCYFVPVSGKT